MDELKENTDKKEIVDVKGLKELREIIAKQINTQNGMDRSFEDIIIVPGCKMVLFLIQFVYKCELYIPSPSFPFYAHQHQMLNGKQPIWINTSLNSMWKITPSKLEEVNCIFIYFMNNNNMTYNNIMKDFSKK